MGLAPLQEKTRELVLCHVRLRQEDNHMQAMKGLHKKKPGSSQDPGSTNTLILDLLAFVTVKINVFVYVTKSVVFCYMKLNYSTTSRVIVVVVVFYPSFGKGAML